jgi:hypothetical protein
MALTTVQCFQDQYHVQSFSVVLDIEHWMQEDDSVPLSIQMVPINYE